MSLTHKKLSYGLPKAVTNDVGLFIINNFTLILLMAATISTRLLGLGTSMVPIYWKKQKYHYKFIAFNIIYLLTSALYSLMSTLFITW